MVRTANFRITNEPKNVIPRLSIYVLRLVIASLVCFNKGDLSVLISLLGPF